MPDTAHSHPVVVIGAGPAGLMAAEVIARAGVAVAVFDAMPSAGRKLLRAGIGGLNLTHGEPLSRFVERYGDRSHRLAPLLAAFGPEQLLAWVHGLGIDTFVGSSQRVFPVGKKAAPLLRTWLHRLRAMGVRFHMRSRWLGWQEGQLALKTPDGTQRIAPAATVLALGGASWPELGSDGSWVATLEDRGIAVASLRPSNCGFEVAWSAHFRERFCRQPVKSVRARLDSSDWHSGELMVTAAGLEGGLIYALSARARDQVAREGGAVLRLDLNPARSVEQLALRLARPQGGHSLAKQLKNQAGIEGVKAGLLREFCSREAMNDPHLLAQQIKQLAIPLGEPFGLARAISSAGGVRFDELTDELMLARLPGLFCAGEMLDWEAPTGGYLLTGCLASGWVAGHGAVQWLASSRAPL